MEIPTWEQDAPDPVFVQVADHLQARIEAGEWRKGARMPPHLDLARDLGVAYMTVRRSMKLLQERGIVKIVHGKGTYVV